MTSPSNDAMVGPNFAVVVLEFRNDNDSTILSVTESPNKLTLAAANDTYERYSVTATAPMGTTSVGFAIVFGQPDGVSGGSVFWDDAALTRVCDS